jgi:NAD(P)-dependent dehydrogenase (short-subunit alcohol dehydrogenase family)
VSIAAAVDQVVALHGKIDVLVNNAGLARAHRALDVTETE